MDHQELATLADLTAVHDQSQSCRVDQLLAVADADVETFFSGPSGAMA